MSVLVFFLDLGVAGDDVVDEGRFKTITEKEIANKHCCAKPRARQLEEETEERLTFYNDVICVPISFLAIAGRSERS